MKKITIFFLCFNAVLAYSQSNDVNIVHQFGSSLQNWCSTEDTDYRINAQKQCSSDCRVKDKIMQDFVANSDLSIRDYVVSNYLNGFEVAMNRGKLSFSIDNYRIITSNEQSYGVSYNSSAIKKEEKKAKDIMVIACEIKTNGSLNYQIKDLFYILKGKIVKITPYEEVVDSRTGKKKVLVDFSDLEDSSTWGASLNYDKHFPLGFSVYGQSGFFLCSIDVGFNIDSKIYLSEKMEMKDILNYTYTKNEYDPKLFVTATPALFLKYLSIGCGVGVVFLSNNEELSNMSSVVGGDGKFMGSSGSRSTKEETAVRFIIRPQIRGFIPLSSSCYLSVGGGYDFIPKMKDLNGYNVSLGLHFDLDY